MRQLTFIEPGKLEWWEVPEPELESATAALVRPVVVATCDLDAATIHGKAPLRGPFAFGHEFIAEVLEVGEEVQQVSTGQLVIITFQISCGKCARCLRGQTGDCTTVSKLASYGLEPISRKNWGGALSDIVRVPFADAMCVPLPENISPVAVASASDNLPDAWRTVGPYLEEMPGAAVLVMGGFGDNGGSIGLYAAGIARAMGSTQVDYYDYNISRLEIARKLGANALEGPPPKRLGPYPITVDASARPAELATALRSVEPGGVCTSIGVYFSPETPLPLLEMYTTGVTFKTGRAHARPAIPKILELVQSKGFQPELVTTEIATWDDAPQALCHFRTKLVITRN